MLSTGSQIQQQQQRQQQQPGIVAGSICARGADVRRKSLLPSHAQHLSKPAEDKGLDDLIETWHRMKDRRSLDFGWRDRLEYQIIKLDHTKGQAVLCQEQHTVLRRIERANARMWAWRGGSAKFTIESTIARAYGPQLEDLLGLEQNLVRRRKYLRSLLNHDQAPFTLNILPDLEASTPPAKCVELSKEEPEVEKYVVPQRRASLHIIPQSHIVASDGIQSEPASPTSRYPRLSRPRLRSVATTEGLLPTEKTLADTLTFELGARGLHVTFGCHDLREARFLHDQMCVLSPIMLAFTASTPIHRGRLSDFDIRIKPISRSGSDFRPVEKILLARPFRPLYPTYLGIDAPKSRITRSTTNKEVFQRLRMEGFDDALAAFCAQGFSCAFPQVTRKDIEATLPPNVAGPYLFHQFTSSLNPHVQLELPSHYDQRIGFRVNFSSMELQLSDFSNSACVFFVALLRFAILGFDLDFRLPPHMVAENVAKAHKVDGILVEQFWWRSVRWRVNGFGIHNNEQPLTTDTEPTLVSIDHIVNGDPGRPETVGLSGVLDAYLADVEDGSDAGSFAEHAASTISNESDTATISKYLAFIRRRAKGSVRTDARLIRDFITNHPDYEEDEVLSSGIWYDIVKRVEEMNDGLLGGGL